MTVDMLCYKDWYVTWLTQSLFPCPHTLLQLTNCSICSSLPDTGIYWNRKQRFADYCEINITRKCCKAPVYGRAVVCHAKGTKKKSRTLRSKHLCIISYVCSAFLLLSSLNILQTTMCTVPRNTPLLQSPYILIFSPHNTSGIYLYDGNTVS